MTIAIVTARKGGARDAVIAATGKLRDAATRNGATEVNLSRIMAGPDVDHWVIRILFADWNGFGKAAQAASGDSPMRAAVAGLDAISEVVSRRVLVGVDL
ncbi:MAG: hypothetical protein JSR21_16430 [Proteobacteria bacterium]|nr:hypothetical protein [Pseudomonadota bacterium]